MTEWNLLHDYFYYQCLKLTWNCRPGRRGEEKVWGTTSTSGWARTRRRTSQARPPIRQVRLMLCLKIHSHIIGMQWSTQTKCIYCIESMLARVCRFTILRQYSWIGWCVGRSSSATSWGPRARVPVRSPLTSSPPRLHPLSFSIIVFLFTTRKHLNILASLHSILSAPIFFPPFLFLSGHSSCSICSPNSRLFLSYFPDRMIQILEGGIESGFHHVEAIISLPFWIVYALLN